METFEDIYISDATVLSGIRPAGRSTNRLSGRTDNGLLYIWRGEALFSEHLGNSLTAQSGDLVYIPKGCRYKMQYTAPDTTFVLINLEMFDRCPRIFCFPKPLQFWQKIILPIELQESWRNWSAVVLSKAFRLFFTEKS